MRYIADDGELFDIECECRAYEASLPFAKLFVEVEAASAANADFAWKIEVLARKLAKDRIQREGPKRQHGAKDKPPAPPVREQDAPYYEMPDGDGEQEGEAA